MSWGEGGQLALHILHLDLHELPQLVGHVSRRRLVAQGSSEQGPSAQDRYLNCFAAALPSVDRSSAEMEE